MIERVIAEGLDTYVGDSGTEVQGPFLLQAETIQLTNLDPYWNKKNAHISTETDSVREQRAIDFSVGNNPTLQTEKESLMKLRTQFLKLYEDVNIRVGSLDFLIYPAGGADVYPILLTDNLVIIDKTQFLSPSEDNSIILDKTILKKSLTLEEILISNSRSEDALKEKIGQAQILALTHLQDRIQGGFEGLRKEGRIKDNFSDILAGLAILGVDLPYVSINRHRHGYKISFSLQGKRKNIYYFSQDLPKDSNEISVEKQGEIVKNSLKNIPIKGKRGVLIKADYNRVGYSFFTMNPDLLILDKRTPYTDKYTHIYSYESFSTDPKYGEIQFGYRNTREDLNELLVIGRKK
ncbi:MAG TPA: hypothetical protein VLF89_05460 [Candidatus Saccharimonadales bacterium]|nr:hypothetical protein [Candidatus Saccharimonadales bacterium]